MSKRFGNLKTTTTAEEQASPAATIDMIAPSNGNAPPPSRQGRKQIAGFFSPEMSFALHTCARRNDMSLQQLMAEAFNDVLRKYGESPIGD